MSETKESTIGIFFCKRAKEQSLIAMPLYLQVIRTAIDPSTFQYGVNWAKVQDTPPRAMFYGAIAQLGSLQRERLAQDAI